MHIDLSTIAVRIFLLAGLAMSGQLLAADQVPMKIKAADKAPIVGVSWSNFQEERWKHDETAIKKVLAEYGVQYMSTDAQASNARQMNDIDDLVARGARAIIVLAWDADAVLPAIERARAKGVGIIAYDRLIQSPDVFYITFDNVEVGRIQAKEILARQAQGNYVFIKGASTDPNAVMLYNGQKEILGSAISSGNIKVVGDQFTEGWKPENARANMAEILKKTDRHVDAVVASNDGTAGGVIEALTAAGLKGIPVSGQDGDAAALNRVARGTQTVSVFKDPAKLGSAAGWVASQMASGKKIADFLGTTQWTGGSRQLHYTALMLKPVPITAKNLDLVIASRWIRKEQLCVGIDAPTAIAACK